MDKKNRQIQRYTTVRPHDMSTLFYDQGSVHGRFQPPHNGHLEYILAAKKHVKLLWIGIARYDIRENLQCDIAKHRAERFSNPLTYYERISILTEMLQDSGLGRVDFRFVPFPIDQPDRLPDFLPVNIPCFTTVYDEWNRHKVKELQRVGYEVITLWEREKKEVTGQEIRESIRLGTSNWKELVPVATQTAVESLSLHKRLVNLQVE